MEWRTHATPLGSEYYNSDIDIMGSLDATFFQYGYDDKLQMEIDGSKSQRFSQTSFLLKRLTYLLAKNHDCNCDCDHSPSGGHIDFGQRTTTKTPV
jgi:hypothetical protein